MQQQELIEKFEAILTEMKSLMEAKNHDYSGTDDPLANLRACEKAGIPAYKGIVGVRMQDKMSRLLSFLNKGEMKVKDEPFRETLRDLANYCILAIICLDESLKETKTTISAS